MKNILCDIFGHKMPKNWHDMAKSHKCKRCDYVQLGNVSLIVRYSKNHSNPNVTENIFNR